MNTQIRKDIASFREKCSLFNDVILVRSEPTVNCQELISKALKIMGAIEEKIETYPKIEGYSDFDTILQKVRHADSPNLYNEACNEIRSFVNKVIDMRTDAFAEGCEHANAFLYTELELARSKVALYEGDGIRSDRSAILSGANTLDEMQRERDLLATSIRDAGVSVGLIRPNSSFTASRLAKLVSELAESLKSAISSEPESFAVTSETSCGQGEELLSLMSVVDINLNELRAADGVRNRAHQVRSLIERMISQSHRETLSEEIKDAKRDMDHVWAFFAKCNGSKAALDACIKISSDIGDFYTRDRAS